MKRKTKEIAWLTVPVVVLAAIVPGARLMDNWREAHEVPRIEACDVRAPTAWESYQGVKVVYTSRVVTPIETAPNLYQWRSRCEIRNEAGQSWTYDSNWQKVSLAEVSSQFERDDTHINEYRCGLRWSEIVGSGKTARVHFSLARETVAGAPIGPKVERDFVAQTLPTRSPLSSLRRWNFQLEKVEFKTPYTFVFWIRRFDAASRTRFEVNTGGNWQLRSNRGKGETRYVSNGYGYTPTARESQVSVEMPVEGNVALLRGQPAHFGGLLSVDNGWPQNIRVELPQGVPAKPGTLNLPFRAKLAPLPKSP